MEFNVKKITDRVKNYLNPKNIWGRIKNFPNKIKEMPRMDQVWWSKVLAALIVGIIFGVSGFTNWPAVLTMFIIYLALSTTWFLVLRNIETGIKIRQYFLKGMFQYLITTIAIWTILWNLIAIPPFDWFG
ncbi:MAG: hypothetical protein ACXABK_05285 [Candidatus Heimdallarchaeaceae archaeon]